MSHSQTKGQWPDRGTGIREKATILVVDDEPVVRNLLNLVLGERYETTLVESAEQALGCLSSENFDLVISDINMGGMSGLELLAEVAASSPETVVMVISGNDDINSPIEAIRHGAFDYIRKPFEIDQVEVAVERAITHAALLESKRRHERELEELVEQRAQRLHYLAYHDTATGFSNRTFFEEHLARELAHRASLSVIFVSVDRFEGLRAVLGHSFSDRLLREIGTRLSGAFPASAVAAKYQSDEFAVSVLRDDWAVENIDHVFRSFEDPISLDDYEIQVSISVGISRAPQDGTDAPAVIKNATVALSHAKKQGGGSHQVYSSGIHKSALKSLTLETELRHALERGEIELFYQPKIDVNTSRVVGMEALARWNHRELGLVPPSDFIPLAEETGLIIPIGEWILRTACDETKAWQDKGFDLNVAVNLSPRQLQQKRVADRIASIVRESGLAPDKIDLEVTESSLVHNTDAATAILTELRQVGIRISLDDFGTGYSSLGYLKQLPIDVLKIDRSFVKDVTRDPDDAALVMSVIMLAHNLRLKVVAEGVETKAQLRFLQLLRCDEWQGYLSSKPIPARMFENYLENYSSGPAAEMGTFTDFDGAE